MSYLRNNMASAIVPIADLAAEMKNAVKRSANVKTDRNGNLDLRKSNDGLLVVCKFNVDYGTPFSAYLWYNNDDIATEMQKANWASDPEA